jgi:hypothetical protein
MKPGLKSLLMVAACVWAPANSFALDHYGKTIQKIEVAQASCHYFILNGVSEADPVVPNSPWFAIPTSHAHAKELYTMLLTARASGMALDRVKTTGNVVCGHAEVSLIDL